MNGCYFRVRTFLKTRPAQYEEAAAGNVMATLGLKKDLYFELTQKYM